MCGLPFARAHPPMQPVAAPIPSRPRYGGRPVSRTHLVARADSGLSRLADAFGGRIGWTVDHSQSGYNALRHHLLRLRGDRAGPLFAESVGPLVTPRRVIEAVLSGAIDVGPLDSYWHDLLEAHEPDTAARLKTIDHTPLTPMPLLVAAPKAPTEAVERLRAALLGAAADPRLAPLLAPLLLSGFAPAAAGDYGPLLAQAAAAEAASYPAPA
jgi:ABC-type phosphate/phosphonate transport system substrate-binding protein